ncbi:MAG: 50S ribosomal protein L17 [Fusobacteriaceae bacterium]|nr:50S ribosomal protein L17 [Fusobacteriaceae bacterium]
MRHLKSFNKLNRTHSERKALYKNMSIALFKHGRIKTTKAKAKEIRRVAEKLITRAKERTLHNMRIVSKLIHDKAILMKLFDEIAPVYVDRNGGYTRIIKLGRRKGDGADMAYLELIQEQHVSRKKKKKKIIEPEKVAEKEVVKETKKVEEKKEKPKKEKLEETTKVDLKEEVDTIKKGKKDDGKKQEEIKIKKGEAKIDKKGKNK